MAEIVALTFIKPDGTVITIRSHYLAAAKQKEHYTKKGFVFVDPAAPAPTPAQEQAVIEQAKTKKGRG